MSSYNQVFEVYRKPRYDETIQKMETRTYYPYIKSFNNNDVIEISINQRDSWVLMHEAAIVIEGELRRDGGELPQLTTGSTKEIWGVKTCTAVESPRFVIVAFQSDKRENDSVDTTVFDNMHASEVRVVLNGEYYPAERQGLNFAKHSYTESHYNYTQFFNNFKHDASQAKQPLLDYSTFKDNTIFVIDCSKRNTALKLGTIDVKLEIESRVAFPQKTKAYCVIVHDCVLEYLPLSEIVRTVT
ncbi:uncharacterized protein LOC126264187 [Aethina tumida]|uniref:uncharacterized protein LOC126264186 n=2 Tax=Aethina tumida TaxID=116153 RepID=UPI0021488BF7|nr:uncharacterized protein LOC126264186 [Aethina tumida]XP_049816999.1 uncharacterized protein LOC126264187 [Aethina tumida]